MANVKRKYESQAKKDRRLGLILMIPIILVVFGIMGYPFCRALYLSFTNKVVGKPEEFVGLENYIKLFHDPIYWKSLKNTLVYTVGCIAAKACTGTLMGGTA
ncbi:MAG: carbohydrate ABC transporter permease [Blautia faecis]